VAQHGVGGGGLKGRNGGGVMFGGGFLPECKFLGNRSGKSGWGVRKLP